LPFARRFLAARWRGTALLAEVDDTLQELFVECLREDGPLRRADPRRGEPDALLYGVARNVAARVEERRARRGRREPSGDAGLKSVPADDTSHSRRLDREWARALLRRASEQQALRAAAGSSDARRRVELLRLRFDEGLAVGEIAARWGEDPDVVHRAYARAREEFRACIRAVVAEQAVRSEGELEDDVLRVLRHLP
jgi:DNA-directed RNA polymerase specialized sigma24 family protein